MTPTTTPAPMTRYDAEQTPSEGRFAEPDMYLSNIGESPDGAYVLFTDWEAERTRADALAAERDAWMREAKLLEHKTITCGVAATHPDADLTTRFPAEWDSPQHQAVRALRAKCAELEAVVGRCDEAVEAVHGTSLAYCVRKVFPDTGYAERLQEMHHDRAMSDALRGQDTALMGKEG